SGHVVTTRDLGTLPGGLQTLSLPGDLPSGVYSYDLTVSAAGGGTVAVTPYTLGRVQGVSFANGEISLNLGDMTVSLDALNEILSGTTATTTGAGTASVVPARLLQSIVGGLVR
ncbi:MAG: FLgD tudor-like domain-containing protein, partial [Candidatus Eiseniibacteriota bacterium]